MRLAIERGVTVAMGTDICITGMDLLNSWGNNGAELAHLVTLGDVPLQACRLQRPRSPLARSVLRRPRRQQPVGREASTRISSRSTLTQSPAISVLSKPEHISESGTCRTQGRRADRRSGQGSPVLER